MGKTLKKIKDPTLDLIVKNLTSSMKLKSLYLFGSRARGDHNSDSDYDLVAIVKTSKLSQFERSTKARTTIGSVNAAVDVIVFTEREFLADIKEPGTLAQIALSEGRKIDLS